jgi:DNA replication protein DnaC
MMLCGLSGVGKARLINALGIEALKRSLRVISKPTFCFLVEHNTSRENGS